MRARRACCVLSPALALCLAGVAEAQEAPAPAAEAALEDAADAHRLGSDDGIAGVIRGRDLIFRNPATRKLLPREALETMEHWRQAAFHRLGLDVTLAYDSLAMGAINDAADWGAMSGDASLALRWQINSDDGPRPLAIAARIRHRHAFTDLAPSELRAATGAIWGFVDGFTDAELEVPELYVEQQFFERRLLVRYGQMAIDDLLDDHRMRNPKRSFLNQAFSSSPAVGFPGAGLGLVVRWKSPRGWDATVAASNIESINLNDEAEWSFDADALFGAAQLGYGFEGLHGLPARIQLMAWRADALPDFSLSSGRGASLTVEQQWPGRLRSYIRYAWSDGEAAAAGQLVAAGFSRAVGGLHRIGAALGAGNASSDRHRWQGVLELFYRHQLGPIHISPDLQFTVGDGIGGDGDWLLIGGLRIGVVF